MQINKCDYCGAAVDHSVYQCENCGGQIKPFVSTHQVKKRNKVLFFSLLAFAVLMIPFIYKKHVNNTATAIIAQLQTGEVENSSSPINDNIFYKKAQFSQVFAIVSPVRLVVIEYYMTEGRFPISLKELGFDAKSFDTGALIENIQLSKMGEIHITLDANTFGKGKYLIYTPKDIMGGMNIQWSCSSNMARNLIPFQCESIA